jgi:tetratricopeptide (TPR) repeat protein
MWCLSLRIASTIWVTAAEGAYGHLLDATKRAKKDDLQNILQTTVFRCTTFAKLLYERTFKEMAGQYVGRTVEAYDQWSTVNPDPDVFTEPAWLLVSWPDERYRNPGHALRLAERAFDLHSTQTEMGFIWRVRGLAHFREERWDECIAAMTESNELRAGTDWPANGFEWFPLAIAHYELGDRTAAIKWYKKAERWFENNDPDDRDRQGKELAARHLYELAKHVLGPIVNEFEANLEKAFDQKHIQP